MSRKSSKKTPVVIGGVLYTDDHWNGARVGDMTWTFWLKMGHTFYFDDQIGTFTARAEKRGNGHSWYAFKKVNGRLQKKYIGRESALEMSRLREVATLFK